MLQPNQRVGGQDKSGLADLIDGKAADDEAVQSSVKNKKKKGAALVKAFEHLQGAPMLFADEVLVIDSLKVVTPVSRELPGVSGFEADTGWMHGRGVRTR